MNFSCIRAFNSHFFFRRTISYATKAPFNNKSRNFILLSTIILYNFCLKYKNNTKWCIFLCRFCSVFFKTIKKILIIFNYNFCVCKIFFLVLKYKNYSILQYHNAKFVFIIKLIKASYCDELLNIILTFKKRKSRKELK